MSEEEKEFNYKKVSVAEAREVLHGAAAKPPRFDLLRRLPAPAAEVLTHHAARWLLALPPEARPLKLARRFPRIANALAATWHNPALFRDKLEEYMLDKRGGRQGFSFDIVSEFGNLNRYFIRLQEGDDDVNIPRRG